MSGGALRRSKRRQKRRTLDPSSPTKHVKHLKRNGGQVAKSAVDAGDNRTSDGSPRRNNTLPMKGLQLGYRAGKNHRTLAPATSQIFGQPGEGRQISESSSSNATERFAELLNHVAEPSDDEMPAFPPNDQADNILNKQHTIDVASDKIRRIVTHVMSRGTHCCEDVAAEFKQREEVWETRVDDLWRESQRLQDELDLVRARYNEVQARVNRIVEVASPLVQELSPQ